MSQALSLVLVIFAVVMLFIRIKVQKRTADGLMVNKRALNGKEETPGESV